MKYLHKTNVQIRNQRVKAKIKRFSDRVRLTVSRSNKHITAQLIDQKGKTLVTVNDNNVEAKEKITKTDKALALGKLIAQKAKEHKIKTLVFDRGAYRYHGRVKAVCEGAREAGIII